MKPGNEGGKTERGQIQWKEMDSRFSKSSFQLSAALPPPSHRGVATVIGGHMSWGRRFWSKEPIVLVLSRPQCARLPGTGASASHPAQKHSPHPVVWRCTAHKDPHKPLNVELEARQQP